MTIHLRNPLPRAAGAELSQSFRDLGGPKRRCQSFGYPPCTAFMASDHQGLLCASCLWRRAEAIVEKGRDRA